MFYQGKTQPAQLVFGSKPECRTRPLELLERFMGGKNAPHVHLANVVQAFLLGSEVLVPAGEDSYFKMPTFPRPVALIAGDLLDGDNATFSIIYVGRDGEAGGGTRYQRVKGIAAAQTAVLKWGQRHYRQEKISE
jgi:hypothetical protein